jgi:hypothetical protein
MIDYIARIAARKGIVESTLGSIGQNSQKKYKKKPLLLHLYYLLFFKIFFDMIFYLINYDEKYFECNNVIR